MTSKSKGTLIPIRTWEEKETSRSGGQKTLAFGQRENQRWKMIPQKFIHICMLGVRISIIVDSLVYSTRMTVCCVLRRHTFELLERLNTHVGIALSTVSNLRVNRSLVLMVPPRQTVAKISSEVIIYSGFWCFFDKWKLQHWKSRALPLTYIPPRNSTEPSPFSLAHRYAVIYASGEHPPSFYTLFLYPF